MKEVFVKMRSELSILRWAQRLRSAAVKSDRNGFAVAIFFGVLRPLASAFAMIEAAFSFSELDRIAIAPAVPAKWAK